MIRQVAKTECGEWFGMEHVCLPDGPRTISSWGKIFGWRSVVPAHHLGDIPGLVFWGTLSHPDMIDDVGKPLNGVVTSQSHHLCSCVADARGLDISSFQRT